MCLWSVVVQQNVSPSRLSVSCNLSKRATAMHGMYRDFQGSENGHVSRCDWFIAVQAVSYTISQPALQLHIPHECNLFSEPSILSIRQFISAHFRHTVIDRTVSFLRGFILRSATPEQTQYGSPVNTVSGSLAVHESALPFQRYL